MGECPGPEELQDLIAGPLPFARQQVLERHLDGCERCRQQVEALAEVSAVVPDRPAPERERLPDFPALKRVMDQLRADPDSATIPGADDDSGPAARPPFLQASDRPGFLGRLGAYEIRRLVGRGGMGMVFEGHDPALMRTVAVKVLSPLAAAGDEARGRFLREAQAAAALTHEHIVTIHAVDQVGGMPFLVMQYVAGESLADRLGRDGRLPFADVLRIGAQVARGLAAAHEKGLVHRDVKPGNILLEAGTGRAKVADFGLAKAAGDESLTLAGTLVGTPEFMSPEQATGGAVGARSDLFSLGAVLYAACSGVSPFRGGSPLLTLDRVRRAQPAPLSRVDPTLPDWFSEAVGRLLMKDPADRIPSASELAELLERPGAAPAARRARLLGWVALLAALVGVAVWAGFYLGRSGDGTPRQPGPPPEPGFVVAGRAPTYRHLAEAVAAARNDDVIEVRGDGPFPTPPVRTGGKRLTIRAGKGSRPVILPEVPGRLQSGPFLSADADLHLEGLDVRWTIEVRMGISEANLLAHCVIVSTKGRLTLEHCRVATARLNIGVGASGRELTLKNCYLLADNGFGVFWRPEPAGRIRVEGCQFENRFALSVMTAAETVNPAAATALLADNTFASSVAVQLILDPRPRQPLRVTARHNVFDNEHLVHLFGLRTARKAESPQPEEMIAALRPLVRWSDDANLYRRACNYLICTTPGHPTTVHPAKIAGPGGWLKLWNLPPSQSVEGVIRFRERADTALREPLRLDKVDDPSGPVPPGVGADADRLGPAGAGPDPR